MPSNTEPIAAKIAALVGSFNSPIPRNDTEVIRGITRWTKRYQRDNTAKEARSVNAMCEHQLKTPESVLRDASPSHTIKILVGFGTPISCGSSAARMVAEWNKTHCVKTSKINQGYKNGTLFSNKHFSQPEGFNQRRGNND